MDRGRSIRSASPAPDIPATLRTRQFPRPIAPRRMSTRNRCWALTRDFRIRMSVSASWIIRSIRETTLAPPSIGIIFMRRTPIHSHTLPTSSLTANGNCVMHERIFVANWDSTIIRPCSTTFAFSGRRIWRFSARTARSEREREQRMAYGLPNALPRPAFPNEHRMQFNDVLSRRPRASTRSKPAWTST